MATPYTTPAGYGDITLFEIIPLALRVLRLALNVVVDTLWYPFSSTKHSLRRVQWLEFVRTVCPNSTVRQLQWFLGNTGSVYTKYQRSLPAPIVSENIAEGAALHWIGPKSNEKIMYFIHGGGFVLPAVEGHFAMVDWWRKEAKKRHGIDFSVAVLEYSLVNFAPWPSQLVQVAAGLAHLLKEGYAPENITIVGDSVGGHEVIFLLGHLIHGHPAAEAIKLDKPLAGAVALSPWLSYGTDTNSWRQFGNHDVMPMSALKKWSDLFIQSRTRTDDAYYFEPALAPPTWWAGLEKVVKNVLVAGGASEGMFDDAVTTEKAMEKGAGKEVKLECYGQEGAAHNEALVEFAAGDGPGPTNFRVLNWIKEVYA